MPIEETTTTPETTETTKDFDYYSQQHEKLNAEPVYDDALELDLESLPEGQTSYKGMPPVGELLKIAQPELRKHWSNIQGVVSRKSNRISTLEAENAELRKQLQAQPNELHKQILAIQEKLKPTENLNLNSDDGWRELARNEAHQALLDIFKPQQEQALQAQVEAQYLGFVDSHEEFRDEAFFGSVLDIMEQKKYPIEDAYVLAKASYKPQAQVTTEFQDQVKAQNEMVNRQRTALNTIGGIRPGDAKPDLSKAKSVWEIAKMLDPTLKD